MHNVSKATQRTWAPLWQKTLWSLFVFVWCGILLATAAWGATDFVVLGHEGIWVRQGSTVVSGDVGANVSSVGPFLASDQEVTIGKNVVVQDPTSRVLGDTMRLKRGSQVHDVFVNVLKGSGQILGLLTTPVDLPLVSDFPLVPSVTPGVQDLEVPKDKILTLDAGSYGLLKVGKRAILTLTGGLYHFREWDIRAEARVYAAAPVEIRVSGHLRTWSETVVGPAPTAPTLTATDVRITGTGVNGTTGAINATPKAIQFGGWSHVRANVYAPNGTLWFKQESTATGAFVGKWVRMGNGSTITLEGGFGLALSGGNKSPVADAGPDQTVQVTETVRLDGSDSTDVDGELLTYSWTLLTKPTVSTTTLDDSTSVMPTFVADAPGSYEIELIVNDGIVNSVQDRVTITTINSPPVADADPDQTVFVTQTVLLDGTNSSDVDSDSLTFLWSFITFPSGSTATLSAPTSPISSFTVDLPGKYEVQLLVHDGTVNSAPDTVVINTQNSQPVANAGFDQTVPIGNTVQLNGSNSSDVDGDPLTFQWSILAMPTGSTATLFDATVVNPMFVADLAGIYVVQLIANDGTEDSDPATVTLITGNTPPVADAGPDQTGSVQTLVMLNGNGSQDADGDTLTFQWSLNSQPAGSTATVLNPTFAQPTFISDLAGTYVVQLVVSDGLASSLPDTAVITAQATALPGLPSLIINNPADGIVVGGSPITVSGLVSDPSATVMVNGVSAAVTGGVFLADGISLQEGSNTIIVSGTDSQGSNNSVSVMVTLSSASPIHLNPLWGPIEWVKQTPDEEIFTANFSNCELSAQYELVVINGIAGGANRVSQGTVLLNGVEIVSAQAFTVAHAQINQSIVVQTTNELELRLQGPIGAQVQAFIACTANCLAVSIDAPLSNATINQPTMVVEGTVTTSSLNPVGIIVNQQAAKVFNPAYAVDGVPVREGTGTIGFTTVVAEATNACGLRASTSLQVQTMEVLTNLVELRVTPDRNVAPSEVTLRVSIDIDQPVTQIQWDHQGDGTIDAQGPDLLKQIVTFTQAGLYLPKVLVTDDVGGTFETTAAVLVEDGVAFETMLNAKWSGMMDALAQEDIEQALTHIHSQKREVMRHDWTVLKDHLGELANTFNVPLQLTDGQGFRVVAQAAISIMMGTVQFPLEVEFVLDTDGQWRIRSF
jgi:uncharacterized Zn-binding protein involved in type VI secretion